MESHHSLTLLLKKDGFLSGKGALPGGKDGLLPGMKDAVPAVEDGLIAGMNDTVPGIMAGRQLGTSRLG